MATRERKAKLSAESPTPSGGSDSAPSTPTSNATGGGGKGGRKSAASGGTPVAVGRVRSTRGSSAQQVADEGEHEKEKVEETDGEVKTPRTPRVSRASAKAAEETKAEVKEDEKVNKKEPEDVKKKDTETDEKMEKLENGEKEEKNESGERKNSSPAPKTPKKSASPKTKNKVNRRTLNRETVMKRRSLPVTTGRSRASTMVTRRNSIAKIEAITKALKEETIPVRKSTRNRRKTKIIDMEPIKKKRKRMNRMMSHEEEKASSQEDPPKEDVEMKEPEKVAKSETVSDSELIRRRSDSVSKCSDTTDNSSFYDAVAFKEPTEEWGRDSNATPKTEAEGEEVKPDAVDMEEDSTTESSKTEEAKGEDNEPTSGRKSRTQSLLRRSVRPRKRQKKEEEPETAPATATKVVKVAENKTEGSDSVISPCEQGTEDENGDKSAKGAPLHVETVPKESAAVDEDQKDEEEDAAEKKTKAASLSPELVSEGVSPISVQQFYGQPAFLENNLGIEEDPKLREIVQVKEIIKQADKEEKPEDKTEKETVEKEVKQEVTEEKKDDKEVINGEIESVAETKEEKGVIKEDESEEIKQKGSEEPNQSVEKPPESPEDTKENIPDKENVMSNGETQEETSEKVTNTDEGSKSPLLESPEARLKKESHFKSLGLLTHEAAVEAKIEKARRREFFKSAAQKSSLSSASSTSSTGSVSSQNGTKNGKRSRESAGGGGGGATKETTSGQEYTGTLKTVIKLHRPQSQEKRKTRMPLKMTFQKGRGKSSQANNDRDQPNMSNSDEDTYYTIQNEGDAPNQEPSHGGNNRKSHNRSHTGGESSTSANVSAEPLKEAEKALVIPEKASSFSIHPGRLCQDQCFYCGGKFGLFDTPCHVAQIKSLERQKKILDNEEKLTVDSCLCDACYRHVDRRANCPSYRNRQSARLADLTKDDGADRIQQDVEEGRATSLCLVTGCGEMSSHLLRRKWFSKMRKQINRLIRLNVDVSNAHGLGQVPICDTHYDIISHLMVCFLCKRKVPRNHIYYINQDTKRLEQLIRKQGIPVVLGAIGVVCKLCRYYAKLLLKPPNDRKSQQAQFVRSYRRRLLSFHNVLDESDEKEQEEKNNAAAPARRGRRAVGGKQDDDLEMSELNETSRNASSGQIMLENDVMVDYDVPVLDGSGGASPAVQNNNQQKMQSLLIPRNQQKMPQISKDSEISRILRANPNISMRELFPGEDEMGLQVYLPFGQTGQRTPEGWTRSTSILQYDEPTRLLWEELQKPYGNQSSFIRHLVLLEKYFRNGDLILSPSASSNAVTYSESVQNRLKSFDNVPSGSLSIFQQLSNAPITITPANPKPRTSSGRQSDGGSSTSLLKSNNTRRESSEGGVSIIRKSSSGNIPPDLISITTTPAKTPASVDTITVTATGGGQKESSPPSTEAPTASTSSAPSNSKDVLVKLPETLSTAERRLVNGKAWRPTLMPIAPLETTNRDGVNTLYQTADGRLLPSRVQVMSGGKPYHISIFDYNRMCILRREKILQKAMANQQDKSSPENGKSEKSPTSQAQPQASTSKGKVQIPNKILEQNSVLPIAQKPASSNELQSLIKVRKPNPTSLLKNQIPIAPKPPVQLQIPAIVSLGTTPNTTIPNANPMMSIIDLMKTTTAAPAAAATSIGWFLNEPPNGPQALVADNAAAASLLSKIPKSLTVIPQQKGRSGSRVSSGEDQSSA